MDSRTYLCIDLKSFYASVECVERGLNPLSANLVVADASRTQKTICLAVSPALKSYGIPGRARLFEVVQKVTEANIRRREKLGGGVFSGKSYDAAELEKDGSLELDFIAAPPRMAYYMEYSTKIYNIYLKYVSPEDIHVYSIDEVFIDITEYLPTYNLTPREFAIKIIGDILKTTGITATAGIGENMYLAKIAMDIVAKHVEPDRDGVRIAELTEMEYRRKLWSHKPITDFWRVGRGYAKRLASVGLFTMGDVAKCSVGASNEYYNEDLLYKLFGVNAQLLIDHAWGWEPCTIADVKAYKPTSSSLGSGQVLHCPYDFEKAELIVCEMAELLALDLVDKRLVTNQMVLTVGYDIENLKNPQISRNYKGVVTTDQYGRKIPKPSHGSINLDEYTSSSKSIIDAVKKLFEEIVDRRLLIRRVNITANKVMEENMIRSKVRYEQMDLLTDYDGEERERERSKRKMERERSLQETMLGIKKQYGKNAVLKGMNLKEGATTIKRNKQIGGHKA